MRRAKSAGALQRGSVCGGALVRGRTSPGMAGGAQEHGSVGVGFGLGEPRGSIAAAGPRGSIAPGGRRRKPTLFGQGRRWSAGCGAAVPPEDQPRSREKHSGSIVSGMIKVPRRQRPHSPALART
eukprot:5608489-Prymnesium_polylepis.1